MARAGFGFEHPPIVAVLGRAALQLAAPAGSLVAFLGLVLFLAVLLLSVLFLFVLFCPGVLLFAAGSLIVLAKRGPRLQLPLDAAVTRRQR